MGCGLFGSRCSTCEYESNEDETTAEVTVALKAKLQKIKARVDTKGSAEANESSVSKKENHEKPTFKCNESAATNDHDKEELEKVNECANRGPTRGSAKTNESSVTKEDNHKKPTFKFDESAATNYDKGSSPNESSGTKYDNNELHSQFKLENSATKKETHEKFIFKCTADVSDTDKALPTTFEGAVELAKNLPSLVKGKNNGKGVPLVYYMIPLSVIAKMCEKDEFDVKYKTINKDISLNCVKVMGKITRQKQLLNDIRDDLHGGANFVPDRWLTEIDYALDSFCTDEADFKVELKNLEIEIKSGKNWT